MKIHPPEIKHKKTALFICLAGFCVVLYGIVMNIRSALTAGVILVYLCGIALILIGLFIDLLLKKKVLFSLVVIAASALVIMLGTLSLYPAKYRVTNKEDIMIILGAGLNGDKVVPQLAKRLDAAVEYYRSNPEVLMIVSGGRGKDEIISEAEAMERYLILHGVPQGSIVKEELSTSTYTNLLNSKKISDERLGKDCSVVIVTNRYHAFRADMIANRLGINSTCLCADTPPLEIPMSYLRECAALCKYLFCTVIGIY